MSLGKDLQTIRNEKKLTLEEIFNAIKIPVSILQSIEEDTLLSQNKENKTYLRSYIRSYAKELRIPDKVMVDALNAFEKGKYDHDILRALKPDATFDSFSIKKEKVAIDNSKSNDETSSKASTKNSDSEDLKENSPTKENTPVSKKMKPTPSVDTVDWADMSRKLYAVKTGPKSWIVAFLFTIIVVILALTYIFRAEISSFFTSTEPVELVENPAPEENNPNDEVSPPDATQRDLVAEIPNVINPAESDQPLAPYFTPFTTLPETLTVAVYAAFDKLEPVRITSDLNQRTNPFWLNQGDAHFHSFIDSLQVRGQYGRMILMFNGHVIENFRQNFFDIELNAVVLTRNILSDPKYLANPGDFPFDFALPDSIIYPFSY